MPLTDAQVKGLKPDRKTNLSDGHGLCVVVQPNKSGDGHLRYFVGRTRHQGKQVEVRIGRYGKAEGAYSLKEARERWSELRLWAKEHGQDPRQWKRQAEKKQQEAPTIEAMAEKWLKSVPNEQTRKDYANKLHHQILPLLGAMRPITDFSWDNARREVLAVMESYKDPCLAGANALGLPVAARSCCALNTLTTSGRSTFSWTRRWTAAPSSS